MTTTDFAFRRAAETAQTGWRQLADPRPPSDHELLARWRFVSPMVVAQVESRVALLAGVGPRPTRTARRRLYAACAEAAALGVDRADLFGQAKALAEALLRTERARVSALVERSWRTGRPVPWVAPGDETPTCDGETPPSLLYVARAFHVAGHAFVGAHLTGRPAGAAFGGFYLETDADRSTWLTVLIAGPIAERAVDPGASVSWCCCRDGLREEGISSPDSWSPSQDADGLDVPRALRGPAQAARAILDPSRLVAGVRLLDIDGYAIAHPPSVPR